MSTGTAEPGALAHRAGGGSGPFRALAGVMHLTLLLLLVQAILAGVFVSDTYLHNHGGDTWVSAHGVIADAIWIVALLAAVGAALRLRRHAPGLTLLTGVYVVAALVETGIGHLISDDTFLGISGNRNGLIAAHIPLAIAIFALGGFIATRASRLARA